MLYSKNGSIPKPQTDGTDGWIQVSDPPVPPEGYARYTANFTAPTTAFPTQ